MEPIVSLAQAVVAGCLVVLGIAHSALGERDILRPLFAAEWSTPIPRGPAERILRFAWHLTSLAWFALAAIAAGGDVLVVVGMVSLSSAALIFAMLRGHLAWPIFLVAGLAALWDADLLADGYLRLGAATTIGVSLVAAAVHVYWAVGGNRYLDRALPPSDGGFTPGPVLTALVATVLVMFASLVAFVAFGSGSTATRTLVLGGVVVLALRAIGDRRVAGFTKTDRNSEFALADDRIFTPLVVLLAVGASGALLV